MNLSPHASLPGNQMPFVTSWSGGKDGFFARWLAQKSGAEPSCLLTMLKDDNATTSAHGLHRDVLKAQADCMGLPIVFGSAGFRQYEGGLKKALSVVQAEYDINDMVFGDIDLQAHKDWYEKILADTGINLSYPLWHYNRQQLLEDMFEAGLETMIVSVKKDSLDNRFLGQILTPELAREIQALGVCPTGEEGDFHTLVLNGPGFNKPLNVNTSGIRDDEWGHSILNITI